MMHSSEKSPEPPRRVGVLLYPGFSNHCLANTVEPLRAANGFLGREAYRWTIITPQGEPAVSSSRLRVAPDAALDADATGELLLVISGYGFRSLASAPATRALARAARRYRTLGGLDTGAWLLAAAGLLDGSAATIHFDEFDAFSERFPHVAARRERWVLDGDRISAGGATAAFDLMRQIIALDHGPVMALEVSTLFLQRSVGDAVEDGPASARRGGDPRVARAVAEMTANLETPLTIADLARRAGASPRDLELRFQRALGATPRAVYRRLRLNHARKLVEETELAISEIALRVGYQDSSAFTRAFRQQIGRTPRALRR